MSRCFPYPPPGYKAKNRDESLIDSIKLQKEREKAKERKQKKKEKSKEYGKLEEEKNSSKRGKDKKQVNQDGLDHKKRKLEEIEQAEKSSLTEEHGQPASTHGFYDSSDSTQSSGKRKRHDTGAVASHNHGNGLRIRLPLLKRKDLEPCSNIEQACSSGRTDNLAKEPKTALIYNAFESGILEMEAQCRGLLDNWKPPQLHIDHPDFDNQEWLFERNQQCKQVAQKHKISDDSIFVSSGLGPRACYLPTTDVYALPYAVPY